MQKLTQLLIVGVLIPCCAWAGSNDSNFMQKAEIIVRGNIALEPNQIGLYSNYAADASVKWQNILPKSGHLLSDTESDSYRRLLAGMIPLYSTIDESENAEIFYNPVFDVALITKWETHENGNILLRNAFIVPGEVIIGKPVKDFIPEWITAGDIKFIATEYNRIKERVRDANWYLNDASSLKTYEIGGKTYNNEEIVMSRASYLVAPIAAAIDPSFHIDQWAVGSVTTAKHAIFETHCIKTSQNMLEALKCIESKLPYKDIAMPKDFQNREGLGKFLGTVFVEGVATISNQEIAFLSSTSTQNKFIFVVAEQSGRPERLSLVDLEHP